MPVPSVIRKNTLLLSASQTLYTIVAQINVLLGAFMIFGLTGNIVYAGLGTAIPHGGRLAIVYHSGRLMDRLGRIKVLQLGTLLCITGAVIVSIALFTASLLGTISGLIVYGVGVGATNQNRVAVADMFPTDRRGEGIGYLLTASVLGAVAATPFVLIGSTLAGSLGYDTFSLNYAAILWLTTIALLAAAYVANSRVSPDPKKIAESLLEYYPERVVSNTKNPISVQKGEPLRLLSYPVLATFAVSGLAQGNMTMNMAFVPEVLHFHNATELVISTAITLHIIGMYVLSTPLGRWSDRIGRDRILMLGAGISGIGALVTPLSTELWTITLGIFLVGVGWSAATVASTALLSDMSKPNERGRLIGSNDVVIGAAALTFPIAAGFVLGSSRDFQSLAAFGLLASFPAILIAFFLRREPVR